MFFLLSPCSPFYFIFSSEWYNSRVLISSGLITSDKLALKEAQKFFRLKENNLRKKNYILRKNRKNVCSLDFLGSKHWDRNKRKQFCKRVAPVKDKSLYHLVLSLIRGCHEKTSPWLRIWGRSKSSQQEKDVSQPHFHSWLATPFIKWCDVSSSVPVRFHHLPPRHSAYQERDSPGSLSLRGNV